MTTSILLKKYIMYMVVQKLKETLNLFSKYALIVCHYFENIFSYAFSSSSSRTSKNQDR